MLMIFARLLIKPTINCYKKALWQKDSDNMRKEFGRIMTRAIFITLLALLLCACGSDVIIEPQGEGTFGGEKAQIEEISFPSGDFKLVGDLRLPGGDGLFPAIIMVHGDGPATRNGAVPFMPMIEIFLRNGYAVYSWDKPGSGESTGELDGEYVLTQRAEILTDGIEVLAEHPAIDASHIGLWGISQAGWVMPMALELTDDVAFMIVVSGGAEDSIEQGAYYVGQQVISEGGSEEQEALVEKYWSQQAKATSYDEYREAMEVLVEIPQIQNRYNLKITGEDGWKPWPRDIDAFIDPMDIIEHTIIPVLAFFGELDKNIDPVQGAEAYEAALQKAGNTDFQIMFIPGVEHVFVYSPIYLETLEAWIQHLAP
jgi:pimeloyl-ACP methyl ester carboxylesterase